MLTLCLFSFGNEMKCNRWKGLLFIYVSLICSLETFDIPILKWFLDPLLVHAIVVVHDYNLNVRLLNMVGVVINCILLLLSFETFSQSNFFLSKVSPKVVQSNLQRSWIGFDGGEPYMGYNDPIWAQANLLNVWQCLLFFSMFVNTMVKVFFFN